MKPFIALLIALLALSCGSSSSRDQNAIYVAQDGNDTWSGMLPEPNKRGTDGPFATLDKARDTLREVRKSKKNEDNGMTVYIREGIYQFSQSFTLMNEDSGTESAPIVWSAYPGERVVFTGGLFINDLYPVDDPAVLKRIDAAYRDNILTTNLTDRGIESFGEINPRKGPRMELFFKNDYMTIARYPNDRWLTIAGVPQTGEKRINEGRASWIMFGVPRGRHYGRFTYGKDDFESSKRPASWSDENDIYVHGYWVYDWSDEILKVQKIDVKTREIFPEESHHGYGYQQEQRYYFLNILEELDSPGEFYIDQSSGDLYFWPPEQVQENDVVYPVLDEPMISLEETSFVTFSGITFEGTRAGAVQITGGTNNTIAGCVFRNIGNDVVTINEGTNNGVTSCDIHQVSAAGVIITGGDRKTLTPAGNYAVNNHISHFAKVIKTYRPAVSIKGVGNRVAHNYIHDAPHLGVWFEGNEHVLEYNEMTRVAMETGDVGGFYTAFDWTYRGNVIRYNYFHHIHGPIYLGAMTVYLDMPVGGLHLYGNVFYDLDKGFFTNSGRDCVIENNIFVKCNPSIGISVYRSAKEYALGGSWRMVERLHDVKYREPPYSTRYPELLRIFNDGDPAFPTGNLIARNISYGGRFLDLHTELDFEVVRVRENVIADPIVANSRDWGKNKEQIKTYKQGDQEITEELKKYGNVLVEGDPGFVDAEQGDFRLKEDSVALKLGFKQLPLDKMGLYEDEYRAKLPE